MNLRVDIPHTIASDRVTTEEGRTDPNVPSAAMQEMPQRVDGVVIGRFLGFDGETPLVVFPGNPDESASRARSLATLDPEMIGAEVAVVFEVGDPRRPLIVGRIVHPVRQPAALEIIRDGEAMTITGSERIELRCGKASIVLEKNGHITLRGSQLTSQATGTNWIRGAAVHLN